MGTELFHGIDDSDEIIEDSQNFIPDISIFQVLCFIIEDKNIIFAWCITKEIEDGSKHRISFLKFESEIFEI